MKNEFIRYEQPGRDAWLCICGNTPLHDGFYPIDEGNHEVEPDPDEWTTDQYFCNRCGRVIDLDTLKVVRRIAPGKIVRLV
jgi:hypothetical protein